MAKSPSLEEIVEATASVRRQLFLAAAYRRMTRSGGLVRLIERQRILNHPALRNVTDGK